MPEELSSEKRAKLIRNTVWVVMLWLGAWFFLAHSTGIFGLSLRDAGLILVGAALVGLMLGIVWLLDSRGGKTINNTMVCDRCNTVKSTDGNFNCQCGGHYFSLNEMKWVNEDSDQEKPIRDGSHAVTAAHHPISS